MNISRMYGRIRVYRMKVSGERERGKSYKESVRKMDMTKTRKA